VADIIGFPENELKPGERKRLEKFMKAELADFQDTSCES